MSYNTVFTLLLVVLLFASSYTFSTDKTWMFVRDANKMLCGINLAIPVLKKYTKIQTGGTCNSIELPVCQNDTQIGLLVLPCTGQQRNDWEATVAEWIFEYGKKIQQLKDAYHDQHPA